ncbi:hypothetical protein PV768_20575 [Pseudarthrobacter sp. CC4]|uniref:hypothetical protein n=3 Tax=Pseudarthrobacter TaxID=1742993 RepID=UPI003B8BBD20
MRSVRDGEQRDTNVSDELPARNAVRSSPKRRKQSEPTMQMISTTKFRAVKTSAMLLCLSWLVVGCSGGNAESEAAPSASVLPSPESSPNSLAGSEVCGDLLAQQESFNYFPPLILSKREGAPEALDEAIKKVEDVDASAIPELEAKLKDLAATMNLGRGEAKDFDYDKFVAAKIEVDEWITKNCL